MSAFVLGLFGSLCYVQVLQAIESRGARVIGHSERRAFWTISAVLAAMWALAVALIVVGDATPGRFLVALGAPFLVLRMLDEASRRSGPDVAD